MSLNYTETTSRRALILGMTNTDQIGMWQARAPAAASIPDHAERIDDAGDGGDDSGGGESVSEATGLTADEQAAFDGMRTGDTPAGDPEPSEGGGEGDPDPDADPETDEGDEPEGDALAADPLAKVKTPEETAADAAAGKRVAPKTVSFGKYQRELKKAGETAAAAQAEAKKAREDAIKLAERVAIINEALSAQPAAPVDPNAPPANPFEEADIDPAEDYAAAVQQERRRNKFAYEASQGIQQDVTLSREDAQMRDTFQRDFSAAAGQDPSVAPAYQFLKDSRLTEICISEFDKDPNDPNEQFTPQEVARMVQIFNAEEKYVVGNALKAGKSPTAAIVRLARARGFKYEAPAAPALATRAAAAPGTPAVPAVRNGTGRAPVAAAAPSAAEQLAALAAAQEGGKSLSDGGGAPPSGLTAQMLLHMGDEEFAELVDGLPKHQLDALMGRSAG